MPHHAVPVGRLLALSVAALIATPGSSLASESGAPRQADGNRMAADQDIHATAAACRNGTANPKSHGLRCLEVVASGFLSSELVLVRELQRPGWQRTVRADGHGEVSYRCAQPASHTTQGDVLTFVGLGASSVAGASGTVQVSVPRIAVYRLGPLARS